MGDTCDRRLVQNVATAMIMVELEYNSDGKKNTRRISRLFCFFPTCRRPVLYCYESHMASLWTVI